MENCSLSLFRTLSLSTFQKTLGQLCSSSCARLPPSLLTRERQQGSFNPLIEKIPWRKEWLPTPVFLPEEFHRQRSLVGYSSWDSKELGTTEQLSRKTDNDVHRAFAFVFSCSWRRQWHPTPVLLPGKSHGQRSLVGCSPWGR